ncbi:MAG: exonuclease SbcCD subunit D, partial [Dehalococcoidia bacterium]
VLFAGDAYKSRDPSQTQQREFARRVRRLVEADIPVFLLVGNHDLPNAMGRASALEIFDTLGVARVYVGDKPGTHRVSTPSGDVQVVAVPWLTPSRVLGREANKNLTIDELHRAMEETTSRFIEEAAAGLEPGVPAVLVAHLSVSGSKVKSGSERAMTVGYYPSFSISSLHPQAFDYVALGHHHPRQVLGDATPVVYAGSMQRVDFGEEHDAKGFYTVSIDGAQGRGRRTGEPEFHPVAARRFVTVEVTPRETDPTPETLAAIERTGVEEAVVRVVLHLTPEQEPFLRQGEVRRALEGTHYLAGIQRDVRRRERRRLSPQVRLEAMSMLEQLELYLKEKETPADRTALLLRYARELVRDEEGG